MENSNSCIPMLLNPNIALSLVPQNLKTGVMKKLIFILVLLVSTVLYPQDKNSMVPYQKAKAIISDLDSIVTPNGVQENFQVSAGGEKQWVYVRGKNRANPLILFVHGGPSSPMAPVSWTFQRPLEEYFTMAHYDQRASGKTFRTNDTLNLGETIHIDQYVDDALEIASHVRAKYNKEKIILMGHSWGTIVALKAALEKPDLFYAYVGIGQVINTRDNELLSFNYGLREATKRGNKEALDELKSISPYPGNKPITRNRIVIARKWAQYYGGLAAYRKTFDFFYKAPLLSPEYDHEDVKAIHQGNIFTLGRILPEFLNVDFKKITQFPVPVFQFMGRHDYTTPTAPTVEWLENLNAPIKKGIWFENSSHLLPLEEPGKFLVTLIDEVRPLSN